MSFITGLMAGAFGGFLGVGGGIIMVPLMLHFFRLAQREAHGTSLLALVLTGCMGAAVYAFRQNVDYSAALILAAAAIGTARIGAFWCHRMDEWKLKRSFGFFLLFVLILLLAKPYIVPASHPVAGWIRIASLLGIGLITGFISGLLGVGGGTVMIPGMVLLAGMTQITAQGSSLLCMIPVGAVGAYTHWKLGNVRREILPGLLAGIALGTLAGGNLAQYMPEAVLRVIFAALLFWTGLRFIRARRPAVDEAPVCEPQP